MKFMNALEQAKWHIKTLRLALIIVVIIEALTILGWSHAESNIRVNVPGHIPTSGLTLTQGEVPKSTVYSFAFYVWQQLNHWPKNGMQDDKAHIAHLSPYLTPTFKNTLIERYNTLLNAGELQDRTRSMQGMAGSYYSPSDVIVVGHGTWIVHLKMRLTETMNQHANTIKDVQMNYSIKVVRYNIDAKQNQWGLALEGFAQSPTRIKTII